VQTGCEAKGTRSELILKKWKPFEKKLWQRNYYEHVIRNEEDLEKIRSYIELNPLKWALDEENPGNNDSGRTQGAPLRKKERISSK